MTRMKIIPLGTSSGKPTLRRNVSATAVVAEGEWWLFDCGEGTQMQIVRAGLSMHRLAGIFITHLHGDHFNGLAGLLSTMALDKREAPLTLVCPPGVNEYLNLLARLKILWVNYELTVREYARSDFADCAFHTAWESDRFVITTRTLDHRIYALGYRLQEKDRPGRFDLEKAKSLGDVLVVGLNTDSSVSRFKGPQRPLQDEASRARIMASLMNVDLVVLFDEDTPLRLISVLLPHILVKGSDYLAENIVGADVVQNAGGVVKTIDFVPGYSTTKIVEKIKTT